MSNMEYWDKLKRPPLTALKQIQGGRLKGMSDISPQWRYQAMTEQFGMCGFGWKYEVVDQWLEDGSDNQQACFAKVNLFVRVAGEWSEAIPGCGGSMFLANEKNGLFTSDEAFKMAITDALGTAMKMIGVAADIYLGNFDGSKYKPEPKPEAKDDGDDEATEPMVQACINDLVRVADLRKVEPQDILSEITKGKLANIEALFGQKKKTIRAILDNSIKMKG